MMYVIPALVLPSGLALFAETIMSASPSPLMSPAVLTAKPTCMPVVPINLKPTGGCLNIRVGASVGVAVGTAVGDRVGFRVGTLLVGGAVGAAVGPKEVGLQVGTALGAVIGDAVGPVNHCISAYPSPLFTPFANSATSYAV